MNRHVNHITQRLSLRAPQRDSLEILADVLDRVGVNKNTDTAAALAAIKAAYPQVEDFERDFPSLCFALATGVGKTRLMGAFITYMYLAGKSRHFFILAPNTTIYRKLIADFSPANPKYVFRGIAEFAQNPPEIITGENYDNGHGVRIAENARASLFSDVFINIFNIDKINKEENPRGRPRMRKLQEYIGQSYYDYLSGLDDLVLLMDEAHRYRGSAGAKAIEGLKPILGLELTATPKTVGAQSQNFCNVIYRYSLAEAMADGFVKEPAVATRKDFNPKSMSEDELEKVKLSDAVNNHDYVTVALDRYHRATGKPKVHPFILVVAKDTTHAKDLRRYIESDDFYSGRFKEKVIEVHSALRGEENEDALERLVALEHDGRTEIVIHVNKLKEGWDVTNLYTIVPLRASASDILTEQTLGRGLRLPYGVRVAKGDDDDFAAVDRLTVIAHDRFDDIISEAKKPGSLIMKPVQIGAGGDIDDSSTILVEVPSYAEILSAGASPQFSGLDDHPQALYQPPTREERQIALTTLQVIKRYERKHTRLEQLSEPERLIQITAEVRELMQPLQQSLPGMITEPCIEDIVGNTVKNVIDRTIQIPEIGIFPKRQITFHYNDFDLQDLDKITYRPIDDAMLIQTLRTEVRFYLARSANTIKEEHLESYLVRYLIERDEIDYDSYADLLYKLATQVVTRLKTYLKSDAELENVLLYHGPALADFIFGQMNKHYQETPLGKDDYEVRIIRDFRVLEPQSYGSAPGEKPKDFRQAAAPLSQTKRHIFAGFKKCCYPWQKFDSDTERRFAVMIDADLTVEKWVKPGRMQFQIEYKSGENYEPDFVIETRDKIVICEVKAHNEIDDADVQAKKQAAVQWCQAASEYSATQGKKPWAFILVPDNQIAANTSLEGLLARFT